MPSHTIPVWTYVLVCLVLILLTLLTLGVSFMHLTGGWHIAFGLVIAVCKGSLVVLFFMHALHSPRLTWIVILVTLFWLLLLLVLTLADYVTRGMIPFTPGH